MGLTSLLGVATLCWIGGLLFYALQAAKTQDSQKPYRFSIGIFCLLLLNWSLYLANIYWWMPEKISEFIFLPLWFTLCGIGMYSAFKERKNNLIFVVLNGVLSMLSLFFGFILFIIGKM